jgi:hypothetical protein
MIEVKRYFKDSGHTSRLTSRINEKQWLKECSYMEPPYSNIAVQRIVDNHTSYMTRARAKFTMDGEIPGPGLSSHRDFTNSYTNTRTWGIIRDGQSCHHLPPTPQPWGIVISTGSRVPEHHARVQRNYLYPLGPWPYGSIGKGYRQTWRTMNRHPNLTLLLLIQVIWTLKSDDEHVKIIAYKL